MLPAPIACLVKSAIGGRSSDIAQNTSAVMALRNRSFLQLSGCDGGDAR